MIITMTMTMTKPCQVDGRKANERTQHTQRENRNGLQGSFEKENGGLLATRSNRGVVKSLPYLSYVGN